MSTSFTPHGTPAPKGKAANPLATEPVLARLHRHARRLVLPCVILIGAAALFGYSFRTVRDPSWSSMWGYLAIAAAVLLGLIPILGWLRNRVVITTGSTVRFQGLLRSRRVIMPHHLVTRVDTKRNAWQAMFGSGDVTLTALDGRQLTLRDVPNMVTVAQALRELTGNIGREDAPGHPAAQPHFQPGHFGPR